VETTVIQKSLIIALSMCEITVAHC